MAAAESNDESTLAYIALAVHLLTITITIGAVAALTALFALVLRHAA
jgi:hypothetical protein